MSSHGPKRVRRGHYGKGMSAGRRSRTKASGLAKTNERTRQRRRSRAAAPRRIPNKAEMPKVEVQKDQSSVGIEERKNPAEVTVDVKEAPIAVTAS